MRFAQPGSLALAGSLFLGASACGNDSPTDSASGGSANGGTAGSQSGASGTAGAGQAGSAAGTSGATSGGSAGSNGGGSGSNSGGASSGGTSSGGGAGQGASGNGGTPVVGGCNVFSADDPWNRDVSASPADATWTARVQALVGDVNLHPDYGSDGPTLYGIPINVVPEDQPLVPVAFDWYEDESDPGPYPFPGPDQVAIEGGDPLACDGDCHLLVVQAGACMLYEGYACEHRSDGWHCGNGAKWDLTRSSLGQRPEGFTSADAAGLAIMPGLLRYDEVRSGEVGHAIRFTLPCTRANYVSPATHYAVPGSCDENDPNAPPMGLRVRLRADFDDSGLSASARVVTAAMKRYGMILADNGSSFYFQGEAHAGWSEDDIEPLKDIPASAFEAVDVPPLEP